MWSSEKAQPEPDVRRARPRVVVASSGLGHVTRGVETWASELARALHERGVCVTLCKGAGEALTEYERVVPCWKRESSRARWMARLMPRAIAWRMHLASAYGVEQVSFALGLIGVLRRERADILHVQDPVVALVVERARRLGLVRCRVILAHGTEEPASFLRTLPLVQHLAPSHGDRCRELGVWRPGWTTIPNFVNTGEFAPGRDDALRAELGIPADALVVLTCAAIKRSHKRIDALIAEFANVLERRPELPAYLVIAGGREADTDELIARGKSRLGERVRFLVRFPRERMARLYRCADVFVLASLTEMMPIALLEACASGLPCVVNEDPVLRWLVGEGGLITQVRDAGQLADALERALTHPVMRRELGTSARDHCLRSFGEATVMARVLEYYREVAPDADWACGEGNQIVPQRPARISVIIPAYNSAAWVVEAVESVLAQTRPADEVVVVDDGSTDDTEALLRPYRHRIRYIAQENAGVASARNRGIEASTGDLIAFLDADDVWHPRKLEIQAAVMERDARLGLLGTGTCPWPSATGLAPMNTTRTMRRVSWRQLVVRNRFTTSSVMVRRSVLDRVGEFDSSLQGPEDFDLWLRIAERARVAVLDEPLVGYRTVPSSLGRRPAAMEQGLTRVLDKIDARRAWRGRWLLRRRAIGHVRYSCAYMHSAAGDHAAALKRLVASLVTYPFPFQSDEVRMMWARPRMLSRLVARWVSARGARGGEA